MQLLKENDKKYRYEKSGTSILVFERPVHRYETFRQTHAKVGIQRWGTDADVSHVIPVPSCRGVIDAGFGIGFDVGLGIGHGRTRRVVIRRFNS